MSAYPKPQPSEDYKRAIEEVASWLERCCRKGSLYDRAEVAAQLRLGVWRNMEPRRTAARDVPPARAQAEEWVQREADRNARAKAAREAAAAGLETMHDYYGRPVGNAAKSYVHVADALGFCDPSAARVYEYGADGFATVRDGSGKFIERVPIGKRRNTRLSGHALADRVACLRCPAGSMRHPACECGAWLPSEAVPCYIRNKAEERRWHTSHKSEIRQRQEAVESGAVVELFSAVGNK